MSGAYILFVILQAGFGAPTSMNARFDDRAACEAAGAALSARFPREIVYASCHPAGSQKQ